MSQLSIAPIVSWEQCNMSLTIRLVFTTNRQEDSRLLNNAYRMLTKIIQAPYLMLIGDDPEAVLFFDYYN